MLAIDLPEGIQIGYEFAPSRQCAKHLAGRRKVILQNEATEFVRGKNLRVTKSIAADKDPSS
jgi:hypothetical protein